MKKEEVTYLVDLKMSGGKTLQQAREEIKRDIKFLKEHKRKVKDAKREIKYLEQKQIRAKKEFDKSFKKMIEEQSRADKKEPLRRTGRISASTRHLNRILNYLKENQEVNVTRISRENCMTPTYTRDGLNFLIKLGVVVGSKQPNGTGIYSLK